MANEKLSHIRKVESAKGCQETRSYSFKELSIIIISIVMSIMLLNLPLENKNTKSITHLLDYLQLV